VGSILILFNRFRWAACQLETLRKCLSIKKVREVLGNLPKTLDETYERILLSADEDYQDIIAEALRWLCFSKETLTIAQLAEAAVFSATVEPPSEEAPLEISFDKDAFFQDPLDILGLLSGLVVCLPVANTDDSDEWDDTDDSEGLGYNDETDKLDSVVDSGDMEYQAPEPLAKICVKSKILLSHFSVKEYLTSGRLRSQVCRYSMDEGRAHEVIATNCIYFILCFGQSMEDFEAGCSIDFTDLAQSRSFYDCACYHWDSHAREVDYESKLTDLIVLILKAELRPRRFFLEKAKFEDWESPDIPPLYLAAAMALYWPCKKLAQSGVDGNGQRGFWGTALHAASSCDNENIIRLLLDYGANINLEAGRFGTALHVAIHCIHEKIIRFLLHYGADVVSEVGYYDTSLTRAMELGNLEIAIMLLEHGAVMSKFGGGIEAGEALARKDFGKFVAIQVEVLLQKEKEKART